MENGVEIRVEAPVEVRLEAPVARPRDEPVMAIVSLRSQRITVYDANGGILRAPVSSGQRGRETPAGIFSVIQKDADHHSNLYDDAFMPHMQRLTWSGIALHGGPLPGYPASHGCVRMPFDFAERLFDVTRMGLRVIVAPGDVAPVEIDHPVLFQAKPGVVALALARVAEAAAATRKADEARRAAWSALRESSQANVKVRVAENQKRRAEALLATAETALGSAVPGEASERAERDKTDAAAKVAELQTQLDAAKAEVQPKLDAIVVARQAAVDAEAARTVAADAASRAMRELEPVSVLISRSTQRLYVRQGFEPVLDVPVTIQDPDRPIGTHVFTAMERSGDAAKLRWSVVTLESGRPQPHASDARAARGRSAEPASLERSDARSALDRIVIPQDVLDRLPATGTRSSLIVTDEPPSAETSKGTDFVVVLSGEPQGGIKSRRRSPPAFSYARSGD
jgi:lipoprotein-anchoring transpeptidase ErfK/SrfK